MSSAGSYSSPSNRNRRGRGKKYEPQQRDLIREKLRQHNWRETSGRFRCPEKLSFENRLEGSSALGTTMNMTHAALSEAASDGAQSPSARHKMNVSVQFEPKNRSYIIKQSNFANGLNLPIIKLTLAKTRQILRRKK